MPDAKITALTAISVIDVAADVLPIVDISDTSMAASGTTKKITINQILGSSGTATLASATITGALGAAGLNVTGATIPANGVYLGSANNLSFSAASTLGMTLNSTGLGVGRTPLTKLTVSNGSGTRSGITITDGNTASLMLFAGASGDASIAVDANNLVFKTGANAGVDNGTIRMTLDASGRLLVGPTSANASGGILQLSSGITFPATQVASSDANTLDDYEEGTFTPTIVGATTAGTGTYVAQNGRYTKIGNLVTFQVFLDWTAHTGTGNMRISNLPFANGSNFWAGSIGYLNNIALTAGNIMTAYVESGQSYVTLQQYPTGGGATSGVPIDTAGAIMFSGSYAI